MGILATTPGSKREYSAAPTELGDLCGMYGYKQVTPTELTATETCASA